MFWQAPALHTALFVLLLLAVAEALARVCSPLRRLGLPASIVAGSLGLALGPDILAMLPLDRSVLELAVYHGLGLIFIALGLQTARGESAGPDARAMGFAIPTMIALQTVIGLGLSVTRFLSAPLVTLWSKRTERLSPSLF